MIRLFSFLMIFISSVPTFAIVQGNSISQDDPAIASILNLKMARGMCTGTLIAPRVVLTAAHCQDLFGKLEFAAHINAGPSQPCDISEVEEVRFVPRAQSIMPFNVHTPDLLLVKLKKELCRAKPAQLSKAVLPVDAVARGAGHGRGNRVFGEVGSFELKVIDTSNALKQVRPVDALSEEILKVGAKDFQFALPVKSGSSFCHGDSGGPVFQIISGQMVIFGVNSAILPNTELGSDGCEKAYLQILTPVAPDLKWIESVLTQWR